MNKPEPYQLVVKMSEITLGISALDNLASEYYGTVLSVAGDTKESSEQTIEFTELNYLKEFTLALDSFKNINT